MNKLIFFFLIFLSVGVYAQDADSSAMRKKNLSVLIEAELAPNPDYKTRGMSINVLHNFSDKFSVGLGVKPYGLFFRKYDVVRKWFTIDNNGDIVQHSSTESKRDYENDFCMPVYLVLKCVLCARTNAAPFVEARIGKDVAYQNSDLYRAFLLGARFGFSKNYSHAIDVAAGLQLNPVDELGSNTFLFKVGFEF
ncbi:MAG: hypothetical protein K6F33_11200 [Bacteroidales bacterium]|nr:hypothetical protein [Bacteroidales bacterium]